MLQSKVQAGEQEMERLRERVRSDLRSIKSNEKNLENQLEMLKRDAETRIAMRNSVITELKRKLDLTEFNLDLVQDKLVRERERGEDLRGKLIRASQAVRVAGGLLDPPEPAVDSDGDSAGVDHDASNRKVS
jgi:chromosome segregation ATPase